MDKNKLSLLEHIKKFSDTRPRKEVVNELCEILMIEMALLVIERDEAEGSFCMAPALSCADSMLDIKCGKKLVSHVKSLAVNKVRILTDHPTTQPTKK